MKQNIIIFVVFFVIIYLIYYFLYVRRRLVYDKNNLSSDIKILQGYYKIDIEKIGYHRVLKILNFVNSLMLSLMIMVVYKLDSFLYKFFILVILMIPFVWVTYYFLSIYLRYLERKSE